MVLSAHELDQNVWGVCGFVAPIQAALLNGKGGLQLTNRTYDTVFPVVEQFCAANGDLSKELLDFTKYFGPQYNYASLNAVVTAMNGNVAMDHEVGLAMTANAVKRLLEKFGFSNCDFHGTTSTTNALDFKYDNAIYGLGMKSGENGNFRYGLLHWVYVDSKGNYMTWGHQYPKNNLNVLTAQGYDKITHYLPNLT